MTSLQELVTEHAWDSCLACGCDIAMKRDATLFNHGPANNRCAGSSRYGRRAQRVALDAAVLPEPEKETRQ